MWTATRQRVFDWPSVPLQVKHEVRTERITEHSHDFAEIVVIADGRAIQTSPRGEVLLERGVTVMVRPGVWHRTDQVRDLEYYNLYLPPELFLVELSWLLDSTFLTANLMRGAEIPARLDEAALLRVTGWLGQIREHGSGLHRAALLGLASCVIAEFAGPEPTGPVSSIRNRIRVVMSAMSDDVASPWTVADLASLVSISPSHLHRQFAAYVGRPIIAWLDGLRGERAAGLLVSTDLTVAEIGRRVGWSDPSYATRRFHALYGMAPREYRTRFSDRDRASSNYHVEPMPEPAAMRSV